MFGIESWAIKLIWSAIIVLAGYAGAKVTFIIVDRLFPPQEAEGTPLRYPPGDKNTYHINQKCS